MRTMDSPLPKPARYTCDKCALTASEPIVRPVANPKNDTHGQCSNRRACDLRVLRNLNRSKEQGS
jgi:hypothetical protein